MTPTERRQNQTLIRYRRLIEAIQAVHGDRGMLAWLESHGARPLVRQGRIAEVERMWQREQQP